jgi:hypothetical protein
MIYDIIDEENPWHKILKWITLKAASGFDAAAFYCPYMPLTMSSSIADLKQNVQTHYETLNSIVKVYSPNLASNTSVMLPYKYG